MRFAAIIYLIFAAIYPEICSYLPDNEEEEEGELLGATDQDKALRQSEEGNGSRLVCAIIYHLSVAQYFYLYSCKTAVVSE